MISYELAQICIDRLRRAEVYNAEADVARIFAHVLGTDPDLRKPGSHEALARIEAIMRRREKREPLARILGQVDFWGLPITTHDGVFRPYPESEALLAPVLAHFTDAAQPLRVLDMGTGSGCLLLAVLKEYPQASGIGIDCAPRAVAAAAENAARLGYDGRAEFRVSDWGQGVSERFDLVISNPPRVPSKLVPRLLPEMRDHDPRLAYDGGRDGLDCFRALAEGFATWCKPGGCGVFQVSDAHAVRRIFQRRTRADVVINKNYIGLESSVSVILSSVEPKMTRIGLYGQKECLEKP